MDDSTANFLRLLNEQNTAIAAREAELEANKPQPDLVRLQREQERREKWGELRARERRSHRPHQVRRVFPFVNPS
jgi:hypothetical protein